MALTKNEIIKIKENLHDLRKDHKYTLQKLSDELKKQGFDLSSTNLGNYEITDQTHENYNRTEGMSVKNLIALADFYGVTVDYLLGRAECTTPTNEKIKDITGLSDKAITVLKILQRSHVNGEAEVLNLDYMVPIISFLIEQEAKFYQIFSLTEEDADDVDIELNNQYMKYHENSKNCIPVLSYLCELFATPYSNEKLYLTAHGKLYSHNDYEKLSNVDKNLVGEYNQNLIIENALISQINDRIKECRYKWQSDNGGNQDGDDNEKE